MRGLGACGSGEGGEGLLEIETETENEKLKSLETFVCVCVCFHVLTIYNFSGWMNLDISSVLLIFLRGFFGFFERRMG